MKTSARLSAAVVGFLLPWQTRWIIFAPVSGGAVWDFGVVSLYVAEAALLIWLGREFWRVRSMARAWMVKNIWQQQRNKIFAAAALVFLGGQIFFSANRVLTALGFIGIIGVFGLILLLRQRTDIRTPFFGGFLIAMTLQALMALVQVIFGSVFASTILGIAAHKAVDPGVAVVVGNGQRFLRAYGGQSHPNIFGGYMLVTLLLYGWVVGRAQFLAQKKNLIYSAILFSAAFFFSFSRSAWISALIILVLLYRARTRLKSAQIIFARWCAGTLLALAIIFAPFVLARAQINSGFEQRSLMERVIQLTQWKNVAQKNFIWGTGVWAYTAGQNDRAGYNRTPVHSVPLLIIAEIGLVGVIFFGMLFFRSIFLRRARLFFLVAAPIILFDHYLYSLWPGLVVAGLGLTFYDLCFFCQNDDIINSDNG